MLMMQHGSIKEARFFAGIKHMGEPYAMPMAIQWVVDLFKGVQSETSSEAPAEANQPEAYAAKQDAEVKLISGTEEVKKVNGVNGAKVNGVVA